MRKLLAFAAAVVLIPASALAQAPTYSPGQTGVVGSVVSAVDPNGNARKVVLPNVTIGQSSADGSGSITTGGTAQVLFGGAAPANGFKVAIPASASGGAPCWVSDTTTTPSATTAGSYAVFPQGQWSTEPGEKPAGPVYLNCPTTGQAFSAKRW